MVEALRENGTTPGVIEEFRVLAALRNGRRERPYFSAKIPLAVACPGARGRGDCILSLGEILSPEMPQMAQAVGLRPGFRSPVEPARGAETPVRAEGTTWRGPEAQAFRQGPLRATARPAPSVPSVPRSLALSSTGSRHGD